MSCMSPFVDGIIWLIKFQIYQGDIPLTRHSGKMEIKLSDRKFANLIFMDIVCNGCEGVAVYDTGANMTVVKKSFAKKAKILFDEASSLRCGNNNGSILDTQVGVVDRLGFGDSIPALEKLSVIVLDDSAFEGGNDEQGNPFPADLFLGWDVISQFYWKFDLKERFVEFGPGGSLPVFDDIRWNRFALIETSFRGENILMALDTGHTETMLSCSWLPRVTDAEKDLDTITGLGSTKRVNVMRTGVLPVTVSGQEICLNNLSILRGEIPGAVEGTEGLFGMDILEGRTWELDFKSGYFKLQ